MQIKKDFGLIYKRNCLFLTIFNMIDELITFVIAEEHDRTRKATIIELKKFNIHAIGEVTNGLELCILLFKVHPDIILLDLNMPIMDGNKAFDGIRILYPYTKIIIHSFYSNELIVNDYRRRGAAGYINKGKAFDYVLADAMRQVQSGKTYFPSKRAINITNSFRFTQKQELLMPLLCAGLTNREISREKGVFERAVEKRRQTIYLKLSIKKSSDFYKYAFTAGLQFLGMKPK